MAEIENPKHQRFVAEYLVDLNAAQAAIRAGYNVKGAKQQGDRLLSRPEIAEAVAAGKAVQLRKVGLTAELVLERIRRPLAADIRKLFDCNGNLRPINTLEPDEAALVAGFEVIIKNAKAGDGITDEVHKVRVVDVAKYVELGAKHFALLTDKLEHTLGVDVAAALAEGRKRVAEARKKAEANGKRK